MLNCTHWSPVAPGGDGGPLYLTLTYSLPPPPPRCSAKVCEEKLRYAAYNCVAIDTDMSPWEE